MASEFSIETAPRDPAELKKAGRFMLRQLAEKLGIFTDEESKGKFMAGTNDDQAEACVLKLKALDANGGKASAPAASTPAASVPKRTPSNGKRTQAAAAEAPAAAPGDNAITQLLGVISELKEQIGGLSEQVEGLASQLDDAQTAVKGTNRLLVISMALNLTLAEQVLGAGRNEVIKAVMDDQDDVLKLLQENGLELAATEDENASGE